MGTEDPPTANEGPSDERIPLGPRHATAGAAARLSPARRAVLDLLSAQDGASTVARLAATSGQHENTLREHLDGLVALGLVTRARTSTARRGRPAWLYRAATEAAPGISEGSVGLAGALAEHIALTAEDPAAEGRQAGRAWGRRLAQETPLEIERSPGRSALDLLRDSLLALGFAPTPATGEDEALYLERCAFLDPARRRPEVVCALHAGLMEGLLEAEGVGPVTVEVESFATRGACRMMLRTGS